MLIWNDSADKHGYTLQDVLYAANHVTRAERYRRGAEVYMKFTGARHGDPLVPSIEVEMKIDRDNDMVVFHVNAEQPGFFDAD